MDRLWSAVQIADILLHVYLCVLHSRAKWRACEIGHFSCLTSPTKGYSYTWLASEGVSREELGAGTRDVGKRPAALVLRPLSALMINTFSFLYITSVCSRVWKPMYEHMLLCSRTCSHAILVCSGEDYSKSRLEMLLFLLVCM